MAEHYEKIKPRILAPVFSALVLIAIIAVLVIHYSLSRHIELQAAAKNSQAKTLLQLQLKNDTELLSVLNTHIRQNPTLQRNWLKRDKHALLRNALPLFKDMKDRYGVSHFYFMTTGAQCYLRVHQPKRFGDIIKRQTMQQAMRSDSMGAGVEFGPLGTLTLRVVYPWHFNGRLQGYIELGQEIDHAINNLHKMLGLELALFVRKSFLDRSRWEASMHEMNRDNNNWDQFDDYIIMDRTMTKSPTLESLLYQGYKSGQTVDNQSLRLQQTETKRHYTVSTIPLINAGGLEAGYLSILDDITPEQLALHEFTVILVITTAVMIILIFASFYRYIGNIELKLITSKHKLIEAAATREAILEEAKNTAEEAAQLKDRFLTNISHELRTPMNGVMGMLQVLDDSQLSEQQKGYVKVALDSSNTLLRLINDLLEATQTPHDISVIHSSRVDLHNLFNDIASRYVEAARNKGLEYSWHISPDVAREASLDTQRVTQVLDKLISNAIKFTPQGNVLVHLRTHKSIYGRPRLLFHVMDTGIGIAPHLQQRVFHSFIQGDGSSTRDYGGSGLGLAIAKRLVEQMGGEIFVESEPGEGCCFYFTLPISDPK